MGDAAEINVFHRYLAGTPYGTVEIRQRKDGGPMRSANGRRSSAVHRVPSAKTGRSHFYESMLERWDGYHAEVNTDVESFQTQRETYLWRVNGVLRTYTPDRNEECSDGTLHIIEVKDDDHAARDPACAAKLDEVAEICDLLGSPFTVRTRSLIQAEPLFYAVEAIHADRFTTVTTEQILATLDLLEHGDIPFGDFVRLLPPPHPRPSAFAMMVQRLIRIDLTRGLSATSTVSLVRDDQ